uniref:Scaffolding protein n=1 Tax=Panagrellus redivivus TaxID=6233 RepID=A0A7E4V952_PANRE
MSDDNNDYKEFGGLTKLDFSEVNERSAALIRKGEEEIERDREHNRQLKERLEEAEKKLAEARAAAEEAEKKGKK